MSEQEIKKIVDKARIIVDGYAFVLHDDEYAGMVDIISLDHPDCTMVLRLNGELIATNMDAIEQLIVKDLFNRNLEFLEDKCA